MVLDGQQRLQSLILAVGADINGFRISDRIVDNSDPGFRQNRWGTNLSTWTSGVYGNSFRFHPPRTEGDPAIWDAELVEGAGNYEVFVWYPVYSGFTTNAPYTINHNGISDTVVVNQSINGGEWISLGVYYFVNDGTENITLLAETADSWVIADAVMFNPAPPPDGVVDNSDYNFRVQGVWGISAVLPNQFSIDFRYSPSGDGTNIATWGIELVNGPATYEVFAWHPKGSVLATNAPFTINHAGISDTVLVNQSINGSIWTSLGVYEFTNSGIEGVTLSNDADSWVVADAIKFALPDGIVDNLDAGFSMKGTWKIYDGAHYVFGYGKDFRFHIAGDGTATASWAAELIDGPNIYEVFIWYPVMPDLATNAEYIINHANRSETILVDQSVNGGGWVSLGRFEFADDGTEVVTLTDNADSWVTADAVRFDKR
jgi:hypothetical protein